MAVNEQIGTDYNHYWQEREDIMWHLYFAKNKIITLFIGIRLKVIPLE